MGKTSSSAFPVPHTDVEIHCPKELNLKDSCIDELDAARQAEQASAVKDDLAYTASFLPNGWDATFVRLQNSAKKFASLDGSTKCITSTQATQHARAYLAEVRENPWRQAYASLEKTLTPFDEEEFEEMFSHDKQFQYLYYNSSAADQLQAVMSELGQVTDITGFERQDFVTLRERLIDVINTANPETADRLTYELELVDSVLHFWSAPGEVQPLPYQLFYFYKYDRSDFVRLRSRLEEAGGRLDEDTANEIDRAAYLVDKLLWHNRFDPDDVFFVCQVDRLAAVLNEIVSDKMLYPNNKKYFYDLLVRDSDADGADNSSDLIVELMDAYDEGGRVGYEAKVEMNAKLLGHIDPMLSVPACVPGDGVYDLDRLNAFWRFLDQLLDDDSPFDPQEPDVIVRELDRALLVDLGWNDHDLDTPTKLVLQSILDRLEVELSSSNICQTPDDSDPLATKRSVLGVMTNALWGNFNVSSPRDKSRHSRFNSNRTFAKPHVTLADVFSVSELTSLASVSDELEYHDVQENAEGLYQVLAAIHYGLTGGVDEAHFEESIQKCWTDETSLKLVYRAYCVLSDRALAVNEDYAEPVFGVPQTVLVSRLSFLQMRLARRIVEVRTRSAIARLKASCAGSRGDDRTDQDILFYAIGISDRHTRLDDQLDGQLKNDLGDLLSYQDLIQDPVHKQYCDDLVAETRISLLLTGAPCDDPRILDLPENASELGSFVRQELYSVAIESEDLQNFSSGIFHTVFAGNPNGSCNRVGLNLPDAYLSDHDQTDRIKDIYFSSIQEINMARLAIVRMDIYVQHVQKDGSLDGEDRQQLAVFHQYLEANDDALKRYLKRMV